MKRALQKNKCAICQEELPEKNAVLDRLDGVIPGAVDSGGKDVQWGFGPRPSNTVKAGPLLAQNVAAMKIYAKDLLKAPCCCKRVELKQKCVGTWIDCMQFYGSPHLPETIKP